MKAKFILLVLVGFTFSLRSVFADAIYFAVNATPYDHQMSRVNAVLGASERNANHEPPLALVNGWMSELRQIPYGYSPEWKTPAEMQHAPCADCKGKAVALYERMREFGAKNMRLVIGRRTPASRQTHAWLSWETERGTYLLDPTFNYSACPNERAGAGNYQPYFAFAAHKKYRATGGKLLAQN